VLLSAADAMVLPSASEGLANAWVEALACGTPIVITDTGGARELLREESAGQIVARTPSAIAAAVCSLLAQPSAPEIVARSTQRFSWEAHAATLAERYAAIVAD